MIRAITLSEPTAHSSPLFSDLKILKLGDIYQLYISSFAFECYNGNAPAHFRDFLRSISSIDSHNTQGATHGDSVSLLEKTHYNMEYVALAITV